MSRLSWKLEVFERLNATTRPVGETQPILTPAEQDELAHCYKMGWSPEAFAEMLRLRDEHLKIVG